MREDRRQRGMKRKNLTNTMISRGTERGRRLPEDERGLKNRKGGRGVEDGSERRGEAAHLSVQRPACPGNSSAELFMAARLVWQRRLQLSAHCRE